MTCTRSWRYSRSVLPTRPQSLQGQHHCSTKVTEIYDEHECGEPSPKTPPMSSDSRPGAMLHPGGSSTAGVPAPPAAGVARGRHSSRKHGRARRHHNRGHLGGPHSTRPAGDTRHETPALPLSSVQSCPLQPRVPISTGAVGHQRKKRHPNWKRRNTVTWPRRSPQARSRCRRTQHCGRRSVSLH